VQRIGLTMSGSLVRADAFRRVGGCDERVFVHDAPLFLRLARVGPFARCEGPVALMPTQDPGRWSNRAKGQVLHDVNAALMYFIGDYPDLPARIRRMALRRAAGRAWKFARRHGDVTFISQCFLDSLLSRVPNFFDEVRFISRTCEAFRRIAPIRIPS